MLAPHWRILVGSALGLALLAGCPDDDPATPATDTTAPDISDDIADDTADTTPPLTYEKPDYFPARDLDADEIQALDALGLAGHVRVIVDDRGIPHIYGDDPHDLARVQGYLVARDRIFQMYTLRAAASGTLAEISGPGSLSGDLFLRLIGLRRTALAIDARARVDDPEGNALIEAFAAGVNAFIAELRAGREKAPLEVLIFGSDFLVDWTPADSHTIARLQTWDLGFNLGDLGRLQDLLSIRERHADGPLAGVERDFMRVEPVHKVATMEPEGGASTEGSWDLFESLADPFWQRLDPAWLDRVRAPLLPLEEGPHRPFRGPDFGSNNWVVAGEHTADGRPIVANDTHLALRNPAVFYHLHLSNTLAGGSVSLNGVQFAGAPGIVLGHNDHAAWGATVFGGDVTDVYIERLSADGRQVLYDDVWVDLTERKETFRFVLPGGLEACHQAAPAWIANLEHSETLEAGRCALEVTFLDVPHRGPIIPWSFDTDREGDPIAMSFRWTGLEPTLELSAVMRLGQAATVAEVKDALDWFDVGAQNWVFALESGDIGWYPTHQMPIRKHIAAGQTQFPPFLPMPGHTSDTDWDGFVPRDELPQSFNPAKGWLATANGDPTGASFDNDPFNDGHYLGHEWTSGFRIARIDERLTELVARGDVTAEDMKALQGDFKSNLGAIFGPELIAAIHAAKDGDDEPAQAALDGRADEVLAVLERWAELDFPAASGVGAASGSDEAQAAAATAIFNTWLVFLLQDTLGRHGLNIGGDHRRSRMLWMMTKQPETMTSWSEEVQDTLLWDDDLTDDTFRTRTQAMIRSLNVALDFLADPARVGPPASGGFGTADMDTWRWGALHTVTLRHNVSSSYDIPTTAEHPSGFPRPCDNFCVDASHPGLGGTSFTFSSGAAIRNVYVVADPPVFYGVVPGGQSEHHDSPFYRDGMDLWVDNLAPQIPFTVDAVTSARTRVIDFLASDP